MSRFRIFPEIPWLLTGIATMAVIAGGVARPCWAEERPVIENSIGMKLVSIPAGEFLMGATEDETAKGRQHNKEKLLTLRNNGDEDEAKHVERDLELAQSEIPQHRVIITKPFFLGKYEVTQKEFSAVMGYNPSIFSPDSKSKQKNLVAGLDANLLPVGRVSWEDARGVLPPVVGHSRGGGGGANLSPTDRGPVGIRLAGPERRRNSTGATKAQERTVKESSGCPMTMRGACTIVTAILIRSARSCRTSGDCSTWPATPQNGARTGTIPKPTRPPRCETRQGHPPGRNE